MLSQESLSSIYIEATAFVLVVLVMSIISYKISSRHAREYALKNQKNINAKKETAKEKTKSKETRLSELQQMLDNNMITDDEFKVMKKRLYNTEE
ncbi:MAG: hypothetical protein OQK48_06830 [Sulfurimonas sp.]|uniref:hypothetical protein n=1 Tax=Sulfurimonas sp. TaxID=2022749 RepID=UPI00261BED47|nr:hypothetical protein [Sulfurimonas sp.]MCW8895643.1 hypothetical protein [Sulfurimonas sp.]MCW8954645.1 hypothetical protein [Sulfurimonas sp.]MCW9067083.1 hypothetical protein [Sulfurimonas sp.]